MSLPPKAENAIADIISLLHAEPIEPQQSDEINAQQFADQAKCDISTAIRKLKRAEQAGQLESRWAKISRGRIRVWKKK